MFYEWLLLIMYRGFFAENSEVFDIQRRSAKKPELFVKSSEFRFDFFAWIE
jgi:hypothetical protein